MKVECNGKNKKFNVTCHKCQSDLKFKTKNIKIKKGKCFG